MGSKFVEFAPGREGLVHISQLAWERVNKVSDVLSVGDAVKIKLFEICGTAFSRSNDYFRQRNNIVLLFTL